MNQLPEYFQIEKRKSVKKFPKLSKSNRLRTTRKEVVQVARWIESEFAKISNDFKIEKIKAENLGEHLIIRALRIRRKTRSSARTYRTVHPQRQNCKIRHASKTENFTAAASFDMKANIVLILEVLRALRNLI